jgi:hypothetical protein
MGVLALQRQRHLDHGGSELRAVHTVLEKGAQSLGMPSGAKVERYPGFEIEEDTHDAISPYHRMFGVSGDDQRAGGEDSPPFVGEFSRIPQHKEADACRPAFLRRAGNGKSRAQGFERT